MIGPLGGLGAAATLGQHCPQMTQIRCIELNTPSQQECRAKCEFSFTLSDFSKRHPVDSSLFSSFSWASRSPFPPYQSHFGSGGAQARPEQHGVRGGHTDRRSSGAMGLPRAMAKYMDGFDNARLRRCGINLPSRRSLSQPLNFQSRGRRDPSRGQQRQIGPLDYIHIFE